MDNAKKTLRFLDDYSFDCGACQLTRGGLDVHLEPLVMRALVHFLEHPNMAVSYDSLEKAVWGDETVTRASVHTLVNKVRNVVGGKPNIVNVGGAYLFRPAVVVEEYPSSGVVEPKSAVGPQNSVPLSPSLHRQVRMRLLTAVALVAIAVIVSVVWRFPRDPGPGRRLRPPSGVPRPLTGSLGIYTSPSFSPDGSQISYSWTGPNDSGNFDIYVLNLGNPTAQRLTYGPGHNHSPAWSPNGQWIAFVRGEPGRRGEVMVIPATPGGPERVITSMTASTPIAWTGDGNHIVVPDKQWSDRPAPYALFSVDVKTAGRTGLTHPPSNYMGDLYPSVSPRGDYVAFSRASVDKVADIYISAINDDGTLNGMEQPVAITNLRGDVTTSAWASSDVVVFARGSQGDRDLMAVNLRANPRPSVPQSLNYRGGDPSVDRINGRLAFASRTLDHNIWALPTRGASPRILSEMSSKRHDQNPQISPDETAVVFESERTGYMQIWCCDIGGANCRPIAGFPGNRSTAPRWSPDGSEVVFESNEPGNWSLYVVSVAGGIPRRLLSDSENNENPSFSRDGQWVYFNSRRSTGRPNIWKVHVSRGVVEPVTRDGGVIPVESPDGKSVYFQKSASLWKHEISTGSEHQVLESVFSRSWHIAAEGIYFVRNIIASDFSSWLSLYRFSNRQTERIQYIRQPWRGLSVSRGGNIILFVQNDKAESDVMFVDTFQLDLR